jgi:hypothetical protein
VIAILLDVVRALVIGFLVTVLMLLGADEHDYPHP